MRGSAATALAALLTLGIVVIGLGSTAKADAQEKQTYRYYPEYDRGMLRLEAGEMSVFLGGLLQVHTAPWVGKDALLTNGDLLQEAGFRLRRSRLYVGGQFTDIVSFMIGAELFDQEKTGGPLLDAYVDVTPWSYFGVTVGVTHFPFTKGEMVSSAMLGHLDRSMVAESLSPERQLGMVLHSQPWDDKLTIYAGVFNGLRRSKFFHQGYEGVGISLGNRFEGVSYAARIELEPLGSLGDSIVDLTHSRDFLFGVGGGFFYDQGKTIETMGWSAYLQAKWMGAHFLAEFIGDSAEPTRKPTITTTINATTKRMGVYGELGYTIIPEILALAVRVEWLDANTAIQDHFDELIVTTTATVYAVRDMLKVQVEYTHREELHGTSLENDAALVGVQMMF